MPAESPVTVYAVVPAPVVALARGLGHVISSDAHSLYFRPPTLSQAVAHAANLVGTIEAEAMVMKVPQAIIENRVISVPEPVVARRDRHSRR